MDPASPRIRVRVRPRRQEPSTSNADPLSKPWNYSTATATTFSGSRALAGTTGEAKLKARTPTTPQPIRSASPTKRRVKKPSEKRTAMDTAGKRISKLVATSQIRTANQTRTRSRLAAANLPSPTGPLRRSKTEEVDYWLALCSAVDKAKEALEDDKASRTSYGSVLRESVEGNGLISAWWGGRIANTKSTEPEGKSKPETEKTEVPTIEASPTSAESEQAEEGSAVRDVETQTGGLLPSQNHLPTTSEVGVGTSSRDVGVMTEPMRLEEDAFATSNRLSNTEQLVSANGTFPGAWVSSGCSELPPVDQTRSSTPLRTGGEQIQCHRLGTGDFDGPEEGVKPSRSTRELESTQPQVDNVARGNAKPENSSSPQHGVRSRPRRRAAWKRVLFGSISVVIGLLVVGHLSEHPWTLTEGCKRRAVLDKMRNKEGRKCENGQCCNASSQQREILQHFWA